MDYDPETGIFTRKTSFFSGADRRGVIGDVCGTLHHTGVYVCRISGTYYQMHTLAWLIHYGEMPRRDITHLDGNKLNNSISNLALRDFSTGYRKRSKYKELLENKRANDDLISKLSTIPISISYIKYCTNEVKAFDSNRLELTQKEYRDSKMFNLVFKLM